MKNFKFLIILVILLTACLCVGSTFAADVSISDINDVSSVDNTNMVIVDDSSNQNQDIQYLTSPETIDIGAVIYNSTYGEGINGKVNTNMPGNVTVVVGSTSTTPLPLTVHVSESGEFNIPFVLPVGNYTDIYVSFISDDGNYIGSSLVNFTIEPHNLEVSISYSQNGSTGGSVIITIYVTGEDGITPTGNVIMHVKGENIPIGLNNGTASFYSDSFTLDDIDYILYSGDDYYDPKVERVKIHFPKLNTTINIDVGPNKSIMTEIVEGDDVSVIVTLNKKATGTVRLSIDGGKTWIKVDVINGTAQYIFKGLKAGEYNLIVEYLGNDRYNGIISETTFIVEEAPITPSPEKTILPTEETLPNTGNPIIVLLIALCALGLESFRRKL
ncbi:MAG: Ig-like domain-containing protein [Methanobacteriaceae archaeon]|nr:Ig-like domain-containing protein [Methanobacteriaceae archaeon]